MSQPTPPESAAYLGLITTFGMVKRVMEPFFSRYGVSGGQWGVLRTLQRAADEGKAALRLMDLSDRLLVRPPSVTGLVDGLERMGLVDRVADEADQRSKQISLTPAGRKLVRQMLRSHTTRVQMIMSDLDADEQAQLRKLLERLRSRLESMVETSGGAANGDGTISRGAIPRGTVHRATIPRSAVPRAAIHRNGRKRSRKAEAT